MPADAISHSTCPTGSSGVVEWPTIWWALVQLATAAMNQSCGNVLGRGETHFRFYSRVSPIVCIVDMAVYVPLLVALSALDGWGRFASNLRYEIARRFGDELGMRFDDEMVRQACRLLGEDFGENPATRFVERVANDMVERTVLPSEDAPAGDTGQDELREKLARQYLACLTRGDAKDRFATQLRDRLSSGCWLPASTCDEIHRRFSRDLLLSSKDAAKYQFSDTSVETEVDAELVKLCVDNLVTAFSDNMAKRLEEDNGTIQRIDSERDRRRIRDESGAGIHGAQAPTAMRCVVLGLGVLPPTVKLVAMEGIPWSKVWALMFSISVVLGEVLVFCQARWPTDSTPLVPPTWRSSKWAFWLEDISIYFPLSLHFALLLTVISGFLFGVYFGPAGFFHPFSSMALGFTFVLLPFGGAILMKPRQGWPTGLMPSLVFTSLLLVAVSPFEGELERYFEGLRLPTLPRQAAQYFLESGTAESGTGESRALRAWYIVVALAVFAGQFVLQVIFYVLAPRLVELKLLGVFRVDTFEGALAALMFTLTLGCSVLYYSLLYDSCMTVNPQWTVNLG